MTDETEVPTDPDTEKMYEDAQNRDVDPDGEDVPDLGAAEEHSDEDPANPDMNADFEDDFSDLEDGEDVGDMDAENV